MHRCNIRLLASAQTCTGTGVMFSVPCKLHLHNSFVCVATILFAVYYSQKQKRSKFIWGISSFGIVRCHDSVCSVLFAKTTKQCRWTKKSQAGKRSNMHRCTVWWFASAETCTGVMFGGSRSLNTCTGVVFGRSKLHWHSSFL